MFFGRRVFLASITIPLLSAREQTSWDIAIIGAGVGGCAAALAAARNGASVVLTDETDWIGGQLTSQAVPPDEHPWIEQFGCTHSYRQYRNAVRDFYRHNYPITEAAGGKPDLNPGNGSVSRITHEPRVSLAVLEAALAPHISSGRVTLLLRTRPIAADVGRDRVRAVTVQDLDTGVHRTLEAKYFLDASELGDLLPLTKTEYVLGAESKSRTGERHAAGKDAPHNVQALTFCFAMDYLPGEDHTVDKPAEYEFWRDYAPKLEPAWPGKLLSWTCAEPKTLAPRTHKFDPLAAEGLWTYRRILDKNNFAAGAFPSDICLVNWPQNDYWRGSIIDVPEAEVLRHLARAKQLSLSLLYWMQTEAPRGDGSQGWRGLRLRKDVVGTKDGLAKAAYIRESRRILAEFTVKEEYVGADARAPQTTAENFPDSVGVGSYRIDLHPSTGAVNYIDVSSLPFEIPLGALIPQRVDNLLAACKNIGTTHVTNGCYRLHPVEWNIGESAALAAVEALRSGKTPRQIRNDPKLLKSFQQIIQQQGVETAWPRLRPL